VPQQENQKIKSGINGKIILVVEDVDASFDLLKVILQSSGTQVTPAKDGEKAVEICKKNKDFDLVLMDIPQTACVIMDDKEACFAAGCDGYIAKPIKGQLLLPVLQQVLMNGHTI